MSLNLQASEGVAHAHFTLGRLLNQLRRPAEAEPHLLLALDFEKQKSGHLHSAVSAILHELSVSAARTDNWAKTRSIQRDVLRIRKSAFGQIHERTATTLWMLGRAEIELHEHDSAENYLLEAHAIFAKLSGSSRRGRDYDHELSNIDVLFGRLMAHRGHFADGERLLLEHWHRVCEMRRGRQFMQGIAKCLAELYHKWADENETRREELELLVERWRCRYEGLGPDDWACDY